MSEMSQSEAVSAGAQGFDASTKLTAQSAKALQQAGFQFAIRYLSRKAAPPEKDLTADEVDAILDAGLGLMAVQHVAKPGWTPTEDLGQLYGHNAAAHAKSVGLPAGTSVWLDLEEVDPAALADDVVSYCNAWFAEVSAADYTTGVYVGSNSGLSDVELYHRLKTQHYWKSGSHVPDIPERGYCMKQTIIKNDKVAGVEICRDTALEDAFKNRPLVAVRPQSIAVAVPTLVAALAAVPTAGLVDLVEEEATLRSLAAQRDLAAPMEYLLHFRRQAGAPKSARHWGIANFDVNSRLPRLFIFDVQAETVHSYLCAHGKGSEGARDDGVAEVFSNRSGSNCTSLGVYRCAETYIGKHGFSMRLDGLERTNSHARARAIVVHGAHYVSPEFITATGRIGRSDGCLAVENRYVEEVVEALTGGSLVLAWHTGDLTPARVADVYESMATLRLNDAAAPSAALFAAETELGSEGIWSELEPPERVAFLSAPGQAAGLAQQILNSGRIVLARGHVSKQKDDANAHQNIVDTAAGRPAKRSQYGTAPGGSVNLDAAMLSGVLALAGRYTLSIGEFCGGSHNPNSRHYAGCAVDITVVNGNPVNANNPDVPSVRQLCRELGATEILGPGNPGHSNHMHAAWPRPA